MESCLSYVNIAPLLADAHQNHYAIPAFNILNELSAKAIVQASAELNAPLILQTSVSTVKQIGPQRLIGFLKNLAEIYPIPICVHLDHCTDVELAKRCIDLGWSSVMIDASRLPLEENIAVTRLIVDYAHERHVTVEGELGAISGVEDNISVEESDAHLASVEDSIRFMRETQVDAFAPAVGTAHGLYHHEPHISFERFEEISAHASSPLVVHGGTGLSDEVFRRFIELGAAKINISTAIKHAYCGAAYDFLSHAEPNPNPLKMDAQIEESIQAVASRLIQLFGAAHQA